MIKISILSFLFTADEDGVKNEFWNDAKAKILQLRNAILSYQRSLDGTKPSISDFITSLKQSKANTETAGEATESFSLKLLILRARALLLNAALGVGIGLLVSWGTKKITEAAQRVQNVATQSKEAADAATNTTSSLKDLTDAYEELGDKSGWGTEDFDQAKDIQAEILDLAKEQGTLDENKLDKLDLQNGKYEEQLGLLQDITAEQLEASRYELTQNKDAQGDKLVDTAKKNNRTHYLTVWSAPEMDMGDQIKNAGIDVFNKFGGYGPDNLNDADSIVDYYNEIGKALKYVIDHTTEAERAAGGTYHSLYQFLLDEQSALRDDVDSYNDSTDAINNNTNARRKLQAVDFWQNDNNNSMNVSFTFDKVNSAVQTLKNTIDGFDASKLNELLWGTNEGLSDEQAQALANLRKALTDMDFSADTNGVNAFIQALVQVGIVAQSSANGVDALAAGAQKMEDISSKMDEIQSAYKASTSAMEEYNQYGYMSLDSLQSLLTMNTEYLNCLELVNGKLQVNKQSYAELLAAEYAEAAATILSNAQHEVANLTADDTAESTDYLKEKTEAEKTALENLLPALKNATAATATYSAAQEFANEVEKAGERGVDPAKLEEITTRTNTQLSLLYTNMNAALKGGQALTNQLNGFGSSSKNAGKSSSTTSKSVADLSSAFDTLTKAMKEYNQYGYISADTMKSLIGVDDKFTACLTEQNGKLELNTAKFRTFVRAQLEEANAANDGGKSAGEMKKILDWLNSSVDSETISFEQLTDAIKGYGTAMDEAKEKTDAIKSAFSGLSEVSKNKIDNPFGALDAEDVDKKYQAIRDLYDNTDLFTDERFAGALNPENSEIDYNSDAFKQMFLKKLDGMATACEETGGAAGKYLAQGFRDAEDKIKNNVISIEEYINGIGSTLENINNRMDNFQSAFNDLYDVVDEYNAYGDLSQDSIQKLMALDTKYVGCLELQGDKLVFNKEAFKELYIAELKELALKYEGTDIGKRYAEILQKVADGTWDVTDHMKGMGEEANRLNTIISNLKDLFSSLLDLVNSANDKKSNDLKIQGDAWIDVIDKRIDALNEANEAQERAIELQKAEDALAKAQNNKTVRVYGENGYEWQADASAVREAQSDLSDKRREYKKQDEIDKLNKLKEKIQENINLIGTSWDDYQKKLAYTAQFEGMTYDEMIAHNDTFKDAVLANMQAIQSATNVSNVISKLEALIDTLTKLGNVLGNLNNSTTDGGLTGLANRFKRALGALTNKDSGKGLFGRIGDSVKSFFGIGTGTADTASSGLGSIVSKGFQGIGGIFKSGMNIISNAAGNGFSGITGLFSKGMSAIGGAVNGLFGGSGIVGKALTGIGTKVAGVFGAGGTVAKVFGALGTTVTGPVGLAIGALGTAVTWLATSSNGFAKTLREALSSFISGVGSVLASIGKGVGSAVGAVAKGGWTVLKTVGKVVTAPIRWVGHLLGFAKGTKKVEETGAYNVDEQGEEMIVRRPQKGRVTTLEKGDGVIPANQTETLMGIAKNPIRWLRSNLAKVTGSTAVAVGATKDNADQEAVAQAQETAGKIDSVYSGAFSDIKKVSNAVMKSIKTDSGTIGKVIGGVTSGITGALIGFDSNKVTKSSNTLINSIKKAFDKFKNILGGGSSITGSMDKLLSSSKSKTLAQLDAMKSSFEKTWNEMAEATGVSKDDITATSKEMYDKMTKLVNDTYAAIGDNTALNSEQVEQLTQTLFKSMQSTYTSGWNRIASLTDEMTEEQANKMAIAYKSMSDGCTSTMNSVSRTMANSWNQCGGGVRNLSAKTESTISKAWADTTGDTEKMLYDMRACFDNSWGQAEQGVRNLADNTAGTINGAYTSIKSTSDETMNTKLPSDMANAWKNVEPGATNLSENIKWTMGQAYDNITKGCNDTVTSIKSAFGTAGNDLYNKGQTTDTAKTEEKKKTTTTTTNSSSSSGGSSSSSQPVSGGQSLPDWFKNSFLAGAKEDYKKVKDKVTSSSAYQKASSAVNYVKDKVTSSSAYQKASSVVKDVKEKVSNSKPVKAISSFIDKHKKKASGARKINQPDVYNVDEQGSELMVRQPQAGRYTYLETGDGVVPADITSRLFEMGGNPDAWFQNQMSKYSAPVTSTGGSNLNVSMGNIVIQNPVGSADDLAGEIVRELPNKLSQYMNLR